MFKGKHKHHYSGQLEVQNAAKTLYANIGFMSPDNPIKSVVVTSAVPNEGKTTTAVELARAISTSGKKVLLLECDMRRRSLATVLNVHAQVGMYAVLTDAVPLSRAVMPTSTPNLFLLDTEPSIPNPVDILQSRRFQALVKTLHDAYDFVIIDTPPVSAFVDSAIVSGLVDGTILIVRNEFTKRDVLVNAYEQLKKAGANVLGICATFCDDIDSSYYYAYYTTSGKRLNREEVAALKMQRAHASREADDILDREGSVRGVQNSKPSPSARTGTNTRTVDAQMPPSPSYVSRANTTTRPPLRRTTVGRRHNAEDSRMAGNSHANKGGSR